MQKYIPDEQIDSLCDQFESELLSGTQPEVESYLARVEAERRPTLLYWLLTLQENATTHSEDLPTLDPLRERYPEYSAVFVDAASRNSREKLPRIPGYSIQKLIKRGGQGEVYQAVQERTGQDVAIKLLSTDELERIPAEHRTKVMDRLETEIRTAAGLHHPNIVKVFDAGECADGFYFVMQWVEGGSLEERLSSISQVEAARIIRSIADALQQAHQSDVLHLDVKPHNILFDEVAGEPLLTDFGLACLARESTNGTVAGTPGYMAPEQAGASETIDVRTDVYGLGATFYHLLTGRKAYRDVTLPFDAAETAAWQPASLREVDRNINPDLERICMKCLEMDPAKRFTDCRQVAEAIDRYTETDDAYHITQMSSRAFITSPYFFLVNLLVYLELRWGWADNPLLEPLLWFTMFSMYIGVFFVIGALSKLDRHSPQHLALESLWAIWIGKFGAAATIAGSLRLLAGTGESTLADGAFSHAGEAILMCYPMFSALTGLTAAALAARYWRALYGVAIFSWLNSFVLLWSIVQGTSLAPLIYGAAATGLAVGWAARLNQLAREKSRSMVAAVAAPTQEWSGSG